MNILIVLLISIYVISMFALVGCYGEYNFHTTIWSIISIFIPIINTALIIYLLFKNKREEVSKFFSIKDFFNDLKK